MNFDQWSVVGGQLSVVESPSKPATHDFCWSVVSSSLSVVEYPSKPQIDSLDSTASIRLAMNTVNNYTNDELADTETN